MTIIPKFYFDEKQYKVRENCEKFQLYLNFVYKIRENKRDGEIKNEKSWKGDVFRI